MLNKDFIDLNIDLDKVKSLSFDFKGFLFNVINAWKWIILCTAILLFVVNRHNARQQNLYQLASLISVETDQSPLFSSATNISFNWGGVSARVGKIMTAIKTRTHNEKVVDSLQYFMQYLKEGEYRKEDVYKSVPFEVVIDKSKGQLLNIPIEIKFINNSELEIFVDFENENYKVQRYQDKSVYSVNIPENYKTKYSVGEPIQLPFFNATIILKSNFDVTPESVYFVKFLNFDSVVNNYKNSIKIRPFSSDSPSILELSSRGANKRKIVDFLNATSGILSKTELERKNLYATNTIKFINNKLAADSISLKNVADDLDDFRKKNKIFNIDDEMLEVTEKLKAFDSKKEEGRSKLDYLNSLESYLSTKTDFTNIAAPTSVGITEVNILSSVSKITALSIERQSLEYTTKEGTPTFNDLDRRINAEKNVLLETIKSTKNTIGLQLNTINQSIANLETKLGDLPENQQEYLKIERELNISQESYNLYLVKRNEAAIIKAANVSDITIIDKAKDIGNAPIEQKKSLNYVMAIFGGILLPVLIVFLLFLLDTTIHTTEDIERLSNIPILGLLGKHEIDSNLVVFEKPKSAIAEAFRSIRSSLQFFYKKEESYQGRTLMITSSVSGEGKTFCSMNVATAYALTGKKTILLGLDLRKPKIFDDFNIINEKGIVNYLIGDGTLEEATHISHIENLHIITSGPVPPNPSELLMGGKMKLLISELRKTYDMIILDTPPIGLVTDALELAQYADASVFMVKLNYTKKGMLSLINAKNKSGEINNVSYVVNFYNHNLAHSHGYGYGYSYGAYGDAYHEKSEKLSILDKVLKWLKLKK